MRLRKKWWARPEMEASNLAIINPEYYKGNWLEQFKNKNPIYLELGCGKGKFLCTQAENNVGINYIGIDLKDEVLVYALRKIQQKELKNVRIISMNITGIEYIFGENEISRIYINFCNPWPKKRHNKRRLTHTRFLTIYKKFLRKGSEIWFKTDDIDLFNESQVYFRENGFTIEYLTYDLHNSNFYGNITTEYEEKFTSLGMETMFLISKLL
ncbi:tRNA (guanosine(46)-N7)-methyltransferase TrmB [Clostridium sp. LBM24168]